MIDSAHAHCRYVLHVSIVCQFIVAVCADMSSRAGYYEALLQVVLQLASHPPAARMFVRPHR